MDRELIIPGAFLAMGALATVLYYWSKRQERREAIAEQEFSEATKAACRRLAAERDELERMWRISR